MQFRAPRAALSRRVWLPIALGGLIVGLAALVEVTVTGPRVNIRWGEEVTPAERVRLEQAHDLRNGELDQQSSRTWQYELGDRSRANIRALLDAPAVEDTGYIDREALSAPAPRVRLALRDLPALPGPPFPFSTSSEFPSARRLFQIQSGWLLLAGGVLLGGAHAASPRRRRAAALATLLLVGTATTACPISSDTVRMGDSGQIADSRRNFEAYLGERRVRFEIHLSHLVLVNLDRAFGRTDDAPARAQATLAGAAAWWFVASCVLVGMLEGWSAHALRYLALAVIAPSALLYFGWREVGYLALNPAVFPLIARGVAGARGRIESGSALAGLGAALHGFGLLSLAGAGLAALAARARLADRIGRALRVAAWGLAAYLGWIALYTIVLSLAIVPGDAAAVPWRPWVTDQVRGDRLNPAILSAVGVRDVAMTLWVVGAPLLLVAASLSKRLPAAARIAFAYAVPSVVFVITFWPIQGLNEEMDLVFAAFPALYALCWICAHDSRRTAVAAMLLVSAHLAFWRIALDGTFASMRVPAS